MSSSSGFVVVDSGSDEEDVPDDVRIGGGEYQIVGIRYYAGVAHPGEFVNVRVVRFGASVVLFSRFGVNSIGIRNRAYRRLIAGAPSFLRTCHTHVPNSSSRLSDSS